MYVTEYVVLCVDSDSALSEMFQFKLLSQNQLLYYDINKNSRDIKHLAQCLIVRVITRQTGMSN